MIWVDSITGIITITLDISFSITLGTRESAREVCSETLNLRVGRLDPEASKKRIGLVEASKSSARVEIRLLNFVWLPVTDLAGLLVLALKKSFTEGIGLAECTEETPLPFPLLATRLFLHRVNNGRGSDHLCLHGMEGVDEKRRMVSR